MLELPRWVVRQNGEWAGSTSNLDDALDRAALLLGGEVYDRLTGQYLAGGQRYHYEWCHDCGGEGCDYCEGIGQIRLNEPTSDAERTRT